MKKWLIIPVMVLCVLFLTCKKQQETELSGEIAPIAQTIDANLTTAVSHLSEGKIPEGLGLLLDTVLLTKPKAEMPAGFESSIVQAKEKFQTGEIAQGVELVSKALAIIKPASESQEEIDSEASQKADTPAPIAEMFKNNIAAAREEFSHGHADQAVILILESFQLLAPRTN